jgi:hypothetical protein
MISPISTSQKHLVICPKCLARGKKEILGEVDENGNFSVLRFHKGATVFIATEYAIQCQCGEIVYQKVRPDGTAIW